MTAQTEASNPSISPRIASITGTTGAFSGIYRLGALYGVARPTAPPYHRAELIDVTGALSCYGWPGRFAIIGQPTELDVVEVTGVARVFNGKVIADLHTLTLPNALIDHNLAPQLLPLTTCPVPAQLPRLLAAISRIADPRLQRFVHTVLADKEVASLFLRVPGSCGYHHTGPGGLLVHSVEVVEPIQIWPGIEQTTRDLAAVGGLFHDVAKIRTINLSGGSTEVGGLVSHDSLTLVICHAALLELECVWRTGAIALMHLWTAGMGKYGYDRKTLAARLVSAADTISKEASAQELAFQRVEDWKRFAKHHEKTHWRPRATEKR